MKVSIRTLWILAQLDKDPKAQKILSTLVGGRPVGSRTPITNVACSVRDLL